MKILWLSPNLNHYKARFLKRLQDSGEISLHLLAGQLDKKRGYASFSIDSGYPIRSVPVVKSRFGRSAQVFKLCLAWNRETKFDWIMIPAEAKNLPLLFFLRLFSPWHQMSLFSYNHAVTGNSWKHRLISKFMYLLLDRVVFYTENERKKALDWRLLSTTKAFFANNTLDSDDVAKHYRFEIKTEGIPTILFIGRLIPNKRINHLLRYYRTLKQEIPDLKLIIIGDGPEAEIVRDAVAADKDIEWVGAMADEALIAPLMCRADVVFNAGLSGLSVNHAFLYGKPYITCRDKDHGPEIWYLRDGENGLVLSTEDFAADCRRILDLLQNRELYAAYCHNAFITSQRYSVGAWVKGMESCLTK